LKKTTTISNFSRLLRARVHPYAFLLACVATLLVPDVATATKYRTVATGNWSAIASWQRSVDGGQSWAPAGAGQTPGSAGGDTVLIRAGHSITLDASPASALDSLTVLGGTLTLGNNATARTLSVTNQVSVGTGGVMQAGATAATHTLNVGGDLLIDGTFDMVVTAVVNVNLSATSGAQTISGSGGTVDFNTLTMSNSATRVLARNISIVANMTINGGAFDLATFTANRAAAGGTLTVAAAATMLVGGSSGGLAGSNFPSNFTTNTLPGTVDFDGTGAQTVPALTFTNLTISGARTTNSVTLVNGAIDIAGIFSPSATFTSGGYVIAGNTVNFNGTGAQSVPQFNFNNLTISGARTTNSVTLVNGGVIGIVGTLSAGTNGVTFSGAAKTIGGTTSTTFGPMTIGAVRQAEELHPDLVFMDLSMPGMSGFDATRVIKEKSPGTRVVVLSSHTREVYRKAATESRADAYIAKKTMKDGLCSFLSAEHLVRIRVAV
jgi:CheY-like chemotaxis protein